MRPRAFTLIVVVYLAVGLAAGLVLGWAWQMGPGGCDLDEMTPVHLREYMACVALARPTSRAEVRCAFPGLTDEAIAVLAEEAAAQAMVNPNGDREAGRALVAMASMFGRHRPDLLVYAATLEASSPGPSEDPTPPPVPEATVGPNDDPASFAITRLQSACERASGDHSVQVRVFGPDGAGLAGQKIRLEWDEGVQDAVTGLKDVSAPGYADLRLNAGVHYRLYAAGAEGERLSRAVELSVAAAGCGADERVTWLLDLTQYHAPATPPSR